MDSSYAIKRIKEIQRLYSFTPAIQEALDLAIYALMLRDKYVKAVERMIEGAKEINKCLEEATKKSDEKHQLSEETSTNEGIAESATTTHGRLIDADALALELESVLLTGFIKDETLLYEIEDKVLGEVRNAPTIIPPVPQKQVTNKLINPCNSLLKPDSDECKEQKSKLEETPTNSKTESVDGDLFNKSFWRMGMHDSNVRPCTMADTSTNAGVAENATTTDCISRADLLGKMKSLCPKPDKDCGYCHKACDIEDCIDFVVDAPSVTPTEQNEEDILKFYYVESLDEYWVGQRRGTRYYGKWTGNCFTFTHSRYLPWGEHVVAPDTIWKEHIYPSEPKEIPFNEWLQGFLKKECPPVEPKRPKGEWKYGNGNGECPFCGHERQDGWDNFCGFCGADMRGNNDEK